MFSRLRAVVLVLTVSLLASGCAGPGPVATPVPATDTPIPFSPTAVPPPATQIAPTDTVAAPTPSPVPKSALASPVATAAATATPTSLPTATAMLPTAASTPTPTATPVAESWFDGVRVTFIHNTGFLITVGDRRILIDVLYEGYPGGVLKPVVESQPPFDGVNVILATHEHHDHFSPTLVLRYLQDNPHAIFISTQSAVEQLVALDAGIRDRAIPIELKRGESQQIDLDGLILEAIHLSHGMPGILNLGFILEFGDIVLFHTGDTDPDSVSVSDLQAYGLPERQIDVALVPDFFLTTEEYYAHVLEGIQPRYVIPMHYGAETPPVISETVFPNAFIFQEPYESWALP